MTDSVAGREGRANSRIPLGGGRTLRPFPFEVSERPDEHFNDSGMI
jgi:hypothetical protein